MRKLGLMILLIMLLALTGCMHEYRLSETESDIAAEYMAGILLKQDQNYEATLVDPAELNNEEGEPADQEEEPTPVPTNEPIEGNNETQNKDNNDTVENEIEENYTLTEVIGNKDFDIQYSGYQLCSVYPEDETNVVFSITPGEGNQLLVVKFLIENITQEKKTFNLRESKIKYQLDINVGTIYKPMLALLENNLQYIDMAVGAGKKVPAQLIFEVSRDLDMANINLMVSKDSKTEIIKIK